MECGFVRTYAPLLCHLCDLSSQICVFPVNAFVLTQLHSANEQSGEIKLSEC